MLPTLEDPDQVSSKKDLWSAYLNYDGISGLSMSETKMLYVPQRKNFMLLFDGMFVLSYQLERNLLEHKDCVFLKRQDIALPKRGNSCR